MIRRLAALAGAAVATLAFAASAQAAPTTPIMNALPYYQCGTPVVTWTPSTPDPGAVILGYRVDLGDLTLGTSVAKGTNALGMALPGLINNHQYVARVRAIHAARLDVRERSKRWRELLQRRPRDLDSVLTNGDGRRRHRAPWRHRPGALESARKPSP